MAFLVWRSIRETAQVRVRSSVWALLRIVAIASGCSFTAKGAVDFDHEIVPLMRQRCGDCHLGNKKKGGLSMNTHDSLLKGGENGPVVEPGKSAASLLVEVIVSTDPEKRMPPKGDRLTPTEVQRFKDWIDGGLPWTEGFSFQTPAYEPPLHPRRPVLPVAEAGRENPIDRIIDADLRARKASRPHPISDATFLRRVSLDLNGLLPEREAQQQFIDDPAPDKRSKMVTALLTNRVAYAEHWLTFWNDLLRNDYSGTGYIDGGRKQVTSWLYHALLENKPYDQFARELIAPSPESEGFARGIKWRGAVSAGQAVPVQFAQSIGQTFLGINLKCASCHDSFIDHWTLENAYGLAAVYSEEPLELYRCDKPTGRQAKATWLFPDLGQIDPTVPRAARLTRLAELMTLPENGRFSRTIVNRLWHRLMGRGIVHPVDAMQTPPWNADLLDYLASDLVEHHYDLQHTLELICTSQAYQSETQPIRSGQDADGYVYAGPRAKRMTAEQFVDAVWQLTGTAPDKMDAPIQKDRPQKAMIRAALLNSDLLMRSLGRPNREQIVSMRPNDLTTLEAMDLSNGALLASRLQAGAKRLAAKVGTTDELVGWLYPSALCRPASPEEMSAARDALGEKPTETGIEDLLWVVCMLPEFQLIR